MIRLSLMRLTRSAGRWLFPGMLGRVGPQRARHQRPACGGVRMSGHGWLVGAGFPGVRNVHVLTGGHEDLAEDTAFEFEIDGL